MFLCCGEAARGDGCCGGTSALCVAPAACCVPVPPVVTGLWACRLCAAWRLCWAACKLCACKFCSDWWARFNWCCCTMLCCTMLCCTLMCWCTASWWIGWRGAGGAGYGGESRWRFTCALWSASCSLFTGRGLWPRLSTAVSGRAGRVARLRQALTVSATGEGTARDATDYRYRLDDNGAGARALLCTILNLYSLRNLIYEFIYVKGWLFFDNNAPWHFVLIRTSWCSSYIPILKRKSYINHLLMKTYSINISTNASR